MPPNVKISDKKGFKFTRANLENPVGKNNLTAFAASFQKTLYREKIYPCDAGAEKPLDTLYENKLHGRVDLDNNVIIFLRYIVFLHFYRYPTEAILFVDMNCFTF